MRISFTLFICLLCLSPVYNQEYWTDRVPTKSINDQNIWIQPKNYRAVSLDFLRLQKNLNSSLKKANSKETISIPLPDGSYKSFVISPSSVMAEELATKFPEIRTYSGVAVDDSTLKLYMDLTPAGFHGMVLSPNGSFYIDPHYRKNNKDYVVYNKNGYQALKPQSWKCSLHNDKSKNIDKSNDKQNEWKPDNKSFQKSFAAVQLKTYRLAVSAQKEYTNFHGGTVAQGLAAVTTAINRVTGVYETELAIRLQLVANNNLVIFTNANDPFSANGNGSIDENAGVLNSNIGVNNYDVGHVFNTNSGLAGLGVICSNSKADGATGLPSPTGDPFFIDYVAHELGHQFGGDHTFNGSSGSCSGGNRNGSTAYEVGSGSTIQAYAGICGQQNLQNNSDPYFHLVSLNQMKSHVTNGSGANCDVVTATGNNTPVANGNAENINNKSIPINTPFELTGSATDPDGDQLTYAWEQWDLGPQGNINANSSSAPIFRSFLPGSSPTRVFPKLSDILNNTTTFGEVLPAVARTLKFQFIVRDNKAGGGGFDSDLITLNVVNSGGAFAMTSQNSGGTFGGNINVTWNVSGTNNAPISCANIDILLSTDGGITFTTTLADNVSNDGSHQVTLPNINSSSARIKIKCSDNVFFDINNANFSISAASTCEITNLSAWNQTSCLAASNTYTQQITVTYVDPPATGMLRVNGQDFAISSSPQTVTLTNLNADGNSVNVTAAFTDDLACAMTTNSLFTAPNTCTVCKTYTSSNVPVAIADNGNKTDVINIPDQGTIIDIDVVSLNGTHTWINDLSFDLTSPQNTTVDIYERRCNSQNNFSFSLDDEAANNNFPCPPTGGGTYNPDNALSAFDGQNPNGNWTLTINDAVGQDAGTLNGWGLKVCGVNATCDITSLSAGSQTACNEAGNTYTQEVVVTYTNPPGAGNLVVNGQSFSITSSPQTVTLNNLNSDGNAVNVTAQFSSEPGCSFSVNSLFTAPAACRQCSITGISNGVQTSCDASSNLFSQEVIITYTDEPSSGKLVVNGQNFDISSSPQTVNLTGLESNGNNTNVTVLFSNESSCTATQNSLFIAPSLCIECNYVQNQVSGSVSDTTFISKQTLESDASVLSGLVKYRSNVDIELGSSFQVIAGAEFEAAIGDCIEN